MGSSIDRIRSFMSSILSSRSFREASSEVILVLANASSRVRKSMFTSSGVALLPLAFFAGGFDVVFGLTLGFSGGTEAADVVKTGAALVKVSDGTLRKAVTVVV